MLGQSQPRISRHLKLLDDAGLIRRHREGAWVFCALNQTGFAAQISSLLKAIDSADKVITADMTRLKDLRQEQADEATRYFATVAADWDSIRALHVPDAKVEEALLAALPDGHLEQAVDLGTGTGRIVSLLASRAIRAIGLDVSHDMLNVARANIAKQGLSNVQLRQADINAPALEAASADLVVVHQVLHYLSEPERALRQAARLLKPNGAMVLVDFAPHMHEFLRLEHQHKRLGFERKQMEDWLTNAGLKPDLYQELKPESANGLTVSLWRAVRLPTVSKKIKLENVA